MNDFEKRWQRLADALQSEMAGEVRPRIRSTRTLFGIRSEVEETMERFAREIEQEQREKGAGQDSSEASSSRKARP